MSQDPIVQEVRAIRDTYAKRFDYNIDAIYRDLKNQETENRPQILLASSQTH